jgi:BirA family biotin operon repressor/biotin-[acetyl-CoA-carboxylase] ligase
MRMGEELRAWLPAGGFSRFLYVFDTVESTNSSAEALARRGAVEGTLVVADHQSRGRGRSGSRWETPPGAAVAMSLILRPTAAHPLRWTALGALAVVEALEQEGLEAQIKWPNDVLLGGRKVAGVLAEAAWEGDVLRHVVLGIGVNISRAAARGDFAFPATSVDEHAPRPILRPRLIAGIIRSLEGWHARLGSQAFLGAWQERLAYLGERVQVDLGERRTEGRLLGLGLEGEARLLADDGHEVMCGGEANSLRKVAG